MKRIKKLNLFIGAFLIAFIMNPICVKAEAFKQIAVELTKEYVSVVFNISTSEFDLRECTISIIDPDGREYTVEDIDDDEATCSINNVKPGKWRIIFNSDTLESVGKVDVKVEGLKEAVANDDERIEVAANITGLKLYLRDDYLVAEWNDTSSGAVRIKVMDSKTLQVLDDETVGTQDDCYYDYKIPSDKKELLVTVVPSTSASIVGAENAYTIEVYNNPAASITYADMNSTNQSSFPFHAKLEDTYKLLLIANNKTVDETEYLNPGEYDMTLPVSAGQNDYIVYVVAENGNMKSFRYTAIGDFIAPELTVTNSSQSLTVNENTYFIDGTVFNFDTLTINGKNVQNIYDDGVFEHEYILHEGENTITIRATDEAGNESVCDIYILYEIPDELPIGMIIGVILGIVLVVFLIFLCLKMFQNKRTHIEKDKDTENGSIIDFFKNHVSISGLPKWNWLITPVLLIVTYFIITHFLIAQIIISSSSMEPTLMTGDVVFFNRLSYINDDIERGDIVCFWSEEESNYMGKRVLGLPGDEVSFKDGYLCINGYFMDESMYIKDDLETNCDKTFTVPENCYFMLGDNREISKDSRYFENPYISKDDIIGKYIGSSGININFFKQ